MDFKDRKDFEESFGELFQEGINQMLKGEMTDHLGYEKNSNSATTVATPATVITKKP